MSAMSDVTALGVIEGLTQCGMRVPEDISVVGFDDSMPARLITPELTTIAQDIRKKASTGVQLLLQAIENPSFRNEHTVLDVKLVERKSVK